MKYFYDSEGSICLVHCLSYNSENNDTLVYVVSCSEGTTEEGSVLRVPTAKLGRT